MIHDTEKDRCGDCGRPHDRPGHPQCNGGPHVDPDAAQRAVEAIEDDLCDRQGLDSAWYSIDAETRDAIRDEWAELIRKAMS